MPNREYLQPKIPMSEAILQQALDAIPVPFDSPEYATRAAIGVAKASMLIDRDRALTLIENNKQHIIVSYYPNSTRLDCFYNILGFELENNMQEQIDVTLEQVREVRNNRTKQFGPEKLVETFIQHSIVVEPDLIRDIVQDIFQYVRSSTIIDELIITGLSEHHPQKACQLLHNHMLNHDYIRTPDFIYEMHEFMVRYSGITTAQEIAESAKNYHGQDLPYLLLEVGTRLKDSDKKTSKSYIDLALKILKDNGYLFSTQFERTYELLLGVDKKAAEKFRKKFEDVHASSFNHAHIAKMTKSKLLSHDKKTDELVALGLSTYHTYHFKKILIDVATSDPDVVLDLIKKYPCLEERDEHTEGLLDFVTTILCTKAYSLIHLKKFGEAQRALDKAHQRALNIKPTYSASTGEPIYDKDQGPKLQAIKACSLAEIAKCYSLLEDKIANRFSYDFDDEYF